MTTPQQPSPAQAPDLMQTAPEKPVSDTPRSDWAKRYFTQNPNQTPLFGQDPEIAWVPLRTAAWLERDRNALRDEVERLRAASTELLDHYVSLANSGDAGFWEPEEESVVINMRTALARKEQP